MIVEVHGHDLPGGRTVRMSTVRRDDGSSSAVEIIVPSDLAAPESDDATGPFGLSVLMAMRLGEDLEVEGRVDGRLLARCDRLQDHLEACGAGRLRRVSVRVTGGPLPPGSTPSPLTAGFLSRGVDSLFQAAQGRGLHGPLDALVFVDRLEPLHDDAVRERERELAGQAAGELGLPLVIAEAPLRELADPLFDWDDAAGSGLAWVAHSLSGGFGRLVLAAGESVRFLSPAGSGVALDPLLSSGRMRLEPGDVSRTRMAKVQWLSEHRPELLPLVKVCYEANRPDNCGRCGKCLHTMACLRAAGTLDRATGFPAELDVEAFASKRHSLVTVMVEMAAVRDAAAAAGDGELESAAAETLRRSVASPSVPPKERPSFRALHSQALRAVLGHGGEPDHRRLGLVRALDLRGRRHLHGAGWVPPGQVTAELGALVSDERPGTVPLWVLPDGRIATRDVAPRGARPTRARRLRHALSPLRRADARRTVRRLVDLAITAPLCPAAPAPGTAPDAFLHEQPGPDRIELWAGEHPVTGDQYTASSAGAVTAGGYAEPRLLGHLEAEAPVTGRLGTHRTPIIPWA